MKHQQIQLASKRNFIRVAALVVMLVLMVCCTVILTTAEPVPESFVGSHDHIPGETGFRLGENGKWVKTYDGTTGIGENHYLWVNVNGQTILADKVEFNSPNVGEATYITVEYTVGDEKCYAELPAEILPVQLTWSGEGVATTPYNPADNSYEVEVDLNGATLVGAVNGETVDFETPINVTFVANDLIGDKDGVYTYVEVALNPANTNYVVAPLKVKINVTPIVIDSVTWVGTDGTYTYGDDLTAIKALGNGNVPMIVKALVDGEWKALADVTAAGEYELVAIAPNALYTVADGVNTAASSITIQKATYTIVLKDGYYIDNGEILNATAGFGYQLVVEGKDGQFVPEWVLTAITYEYIGEDGKAVKKVTKPGVYTVKVSAPELANANVIIEKDTAILTVVANYRVIATPDGSMLIVGKDGVPASVETSLSIPTLNRTTVRGLRLYKAYTLTINNAEGLAFEVRVPVSAEFTADENCYPLAVANLYIVDAEGNKVLATDLYNVELSEDGFYYIIKGYTTAGAVTFLIAPEYDTPFWSSAIGIAILVFIALILLVVVPLIVGLVLIRIERSGNNPVITVETLGILPEFEPVIIPDKIADADTILEEGLEAKAEDLFAEVEAAEAEVDVDANLAVAEAMAELDEELANIDLMADANAAADDLADQFALGLIDGVEAEEATPDVSEEVEQAVADAMAENFNESADATDAVALVEEETVEETPEEVVEEAPEEVVEEVAVEEPVEEVVIEEANDDDAAEEANEDESDDDDEDSFGGFGSMPLDYIDAIAEADRYAEMLEQESRGEVQLVTRYRRSYLSRLAQSQGSIQDYYNAIKNLLLSYKGVKSRISWNFESFNVGRTPLAKFNAKTRTLYVYIAYSPEELTDSKYNFTDMSAKKKYAAVPVLLKVKGERKFKHALELITMLCEEKLQLPKKKVVEEIDYKMPFKTTEELVNEGIIKKMVAAIPVAPATEDVVIEAAPVEEVAAEASVEEIPAVEVAQESVEIDNQSI